MAGPAPSAEPGGAVGPPAAARIHTQQRPGAERLRGAAHLHESPLRHPVHSGHGLAGGPEVRAGGIHVRLDRLYGPPRPRELATWSETPRGAAGTGSSRPRCSRIAATRRSRASSRASWRTSRNSVIAASFG